MKNILLRTILLRTSCALFALSIQCFAFDDGAPLDETFEKPKTALHVFEEAMIAETSPKKKIHLFDQYFKDNLTEKEYKALQTKAQRIRRKFKKKNPTFKLLSFYQEYYRNMGDGDDYPPGFHVLKAQSDQLLEQHIAKNKATTTAYNDLNKFKAQLLSLQDTLEPLMKTLDSQTLDSQTEVDIIMSRFISMLESTAKLLPLQKKMHDAHKLFMKQYRFMDQHANSLSDDKLIENMKLYNTRAQQSISSKEEYFNACSPMNTRLRAEIKSAKALIKQLKTRKLNAESHANHSKILDQRREELSGSVPDIIPVMGNTPASELSPDQILALKNLADHKAKLKAMERAEKQAVLELKKQDEMPEEEDDVGPSTNRGPSPQEDPFEDTIEDDALKQTAQEFRSESIDAFLASGESEIYDSHRGVFENKIIACEYLKEANSLNDTTSNNYRQGYKIEKLNNEKRTHSLRITENYRLLFDVIKISGNKFLHVANIMIDNHYGE